MRITAALSWWDEKPEDLRACVRGIANIADNIVAIDGRYKRYPGDSHISPPEQMEAIMDEAEKNGLECLILTPNRTWVGEVEKRAYLMACASVGSDWIIVVDSDHIISCDREAVRQELETTYHDVFNLKFVTPDGPKAAHIWHTKQVGVVVDHPFLMRAFPGITVEKHHWWYYAYPCGIKAGIGGQWDEGISWYPAKELVNQITVEHRVLLREDKKILAARAWYNDRAKVLQKTGQENAVDGLSEPEYDYDSLTDL